MAACVCQARVADPGKAVSRSLHSLMMLPCRCCTQAPHCPLNPLYKRDACIDRKSALQPPDKHCSCTSALGSSTIAFVTPSCNIAWSKGVVGMQGIVGWQLNRPCTPDHQAPHRHSLGSVPATVTGTAVQPQPSQPVCLTQSSAGRHAAPAAAPDGACAVGVNCRAATFGGRVSKGLPSGSRGSSAPWPHSAKPHSAVDDSASHCPAVRHPVAARTPQEGSHGTCCRLGPTVQGPKP